MAENQDKTGPIKNLRRLYPNKDLGETRPFTKTAGMFLLFISYKKLGQMSDSTKTKRHGSTQEIARLTDQSRSKGK